MDWILDVDWHSTLKPSVPLLETFIRGTLTYLGLFVLLRVVLKRQSAGLGVTDLLVVVLIADAAQNAMADDYKSVPDGLLLVAVILAWAWGLDFLAFHSTRLERLLKPPKLPLILNGSFVVDNMRRELITRQELATLVREHGIDDLAKVRVAYMEPDGQLSVITMDGEEDNAPPKRQLLV
jgi:uncharacterized membrane protein YcaP (DUF421 family)